MNNKKLFLNTEKMDCERKNKFLLFRRMEKHGSMYKQNEQEKKRLQQQNLTDIEYLIAIKRLAAKWRV